MTNATQSPARGVEVTQADREAADALDDALGFLMDNERDVVLQAFARHRLAHSTQPAQPEDGSGEVEMLRGKLEEIANNRVWFGAPACDFARAALAIKGGGVDA